MTSIYIKIQFKHDQGFLTLNYSYTQGFPWRPPYMHMNTFFLSKSWHALEQARLLGKEKLSRFLCTHEQIKLFKESSLVCTEFNSEERLNLKR